MQPLDECCREVLDLMPSFVGRETPISIEEAALVTPLGDPYK
jgi:hypothetical protein